MKAARLETTGLSGLRVLDVECPLPEDDEVLIEVETVGVNQLDFNVIDGIGPGSAARLPRTLGLDPAGVIVSAGRGVDYGRIGKRVVVKPNIPCGHCYYCVSGAEADCPSQKVVGVHRDGGMAEYLTVPSRSAFDIGDLDFATATASVHSVSIVHHAVSLAGGVRPGEVALIAGAGGTLGRVAIQYLRHLGAEVIAVSRRALDVTDGVRSIRVSSPEEIPTAVRAIQGDGPSFALDVTGHGATIAGAVKSLGWKGRAVTCSASLDPLLPLDGRDLVFQRKSLVGAASANYTEVESALALVRSGAVVPLIGELFELDRVRDAYATFGGSERVGKVIIDVR